MTLFLSKALLSPLNIKYQGDKMIIKNVVLCL